MKLNDLIDIIKDDDMLIAFLQECGMLMSEMFCTICNRYCKESKIGEKLFFRCSKCKKIVYAVYGNNKIFRKTEESYGNLLQIIYFFVNEISLTKCVNMVEMSLTNIQNIYIKCMDICVEANNRNKCKIGGTGLTVEVDESVFSKRKYNKGRLTKQHWIVGGVERESKKFFLVKVEKRDSKTLTKVIEENIEKGSRIITDKWKGYNNINKEDYKHLTVNHSLYFVDPETGEHTNTIESVWGKVKKYITET